MKKEKLFSIIGKILLLLTTIAWGSSFLVLKNTLTEFGNGNFTFFILGLRFLTAALVVFIVAIPKIKMTTKKTVFSGVVLGLILFGAYGLQTLGLKYTSASKNAFLTVSYCVFVPFMSWIMLKNRPTINNFIAAGVCLLGVAFVSLIGKSDNSGFELFGDMLSVACGVFYALQIIFLTKYGGDENFTAMVFFELFTVGLLCMAVSAVFEIPSHYSEITFSVDFVLMILYLAVICTSFAQFSQAFAQKYVDPLSTSLILSLECVFGALFEMVFGFSNLTVYIAIGFALIFASQIIGELKFGEKKIKNNKIENNS